MNIQQLKYILEIERQGSISKAAQTLFISQPSLSNAIREFESELGLSVFLRSKNGIKLTAEGSEICKYARSALFHLDNINKLSTNKSNFHLTTENCSFVMEAFIKLCQRYESNENMDFTLKNDEMMDVINSVSNLESDLGVLLINSSTFDLCISILNSKNLEYTLIKKLAVNINLRKDHPLLAETPFPFHKLKNYMYVKYANEKNHTLSYMPDLSSLEIINPQKTISVADRELKCSIVSKTDSFSVGCTLHPDFYAKFNITTIPIPDNYANLGFIKTKGSYLSSECDEFIKLLREELNRDCLNTLSE